jgi:hypothetical protein
MHCEVLYLHYLLSLDRSGKRMNDTSLTSHTGTVGHSHQLDPFFDLTSWSHECVRCFVLLYLSNIKRQTDSVVYP